MSVYYLVTLYDMEEYEDGKLLTKNKTKAMKKLVLHEEKLGVFSTEGWNQNFSKTVKEYENRFITVKKEQNWEKCFNILQKFYKDIQSSNFFFSKIEELTLGKTFESDIPWLR